jgi:2-polyprenyl-3-methyl-5-hydroxy-6-metoxy-1,4-benzoquinol methylase
MTDSSTPIATGYQYRSDRASHTNTYLWGPLLKELRRNQIQRAFDLGCGNGALARFLTEQKIETAGVDPSEAGISIARQANPQLRLEVGSAYDDLKSRFGAYPAVVSLEVVEHVYYPRQYATCIANLLEPGGIALISTPYHSYLKNVVLAVSGKMDAHFTALWDHGHIKFWSVKTLKKLLGEAGLTTKRIHRVGRFPLLAKSMLVVATKQSGKEYRT